MSRKKKQSPIAMKSRRQDIRVLEDNVRANQLKIEERNQRALLGAMAVATMAPTMEQSSFYMDNFVDPRDYLGDEYMAPAVYANSQPTQIWNRESGRNYPVFLTEIELRYIRGMGRQMADFHPVGKGVMNSVVNYTIGTGISVRAEAKKHSKIDQNLITRINRIIDKFMEYNDISGDADREICLRGHRDGDGGLGLWWEGPGKVAVRFIEPDQITQPATEQQIIEWMGYQGPPTTMLFGIHSDEDDAASVHGYYVQWSSNGRDWDYIPGGKYPHITSANQNTWCEFFKCNVDRQVKRGISDFFPVETALRLIKKVIRNTGEGAAVQAAIAFIRQHAPGITGSQILQFQSGQATDFFSMRTGSGSKNIATRKMYPGQVLDIPKGQQYLAGPMGVNNAEIYVEVSDALARSAAVRWGMPEWMLNANIKNGSRGSAFIAEAPFTKATAVEQNYQSRYWMKIIWKVISWEIRDVPLEQIKENVNIIVSMPTISVRQPEKETARREVLWKNGIISGQTWASEEGYDHDAELRQGAKSQEQKGTTSSGLLFARGE